MITTNRHEEAAGVSLAHLSHQFGSFRALHDMSLEVEPGEFLTLLGPSGSGKTTLLRIIGGLLQATSGRVSIAGRDVSDVPAERRGIGFVFQHYALFPHLSVRRNVAFPLKLRKVPAPEIDRRVAEILDLVQLQGLADRMPSQLSGGQQQRAAVARAIVYRPSVLLMDEPLGALDKRLRQQVGLELRRLQQQVGITTIYVTHDQEEAFTMSDRVVVMDQGLIRQVGSPEAIYRHPSDHFTATFVGDLNEFEGDARALDDRTALVNAGWDAPVTVALRAEHLGNGKARFGIRPEAIVIDPTSSVENRFRANVQSIIFLGRYRRVEFRLPDGAVLVADVPEGHRSLSQGEAVTIGWPATACVALPSGKVPT